VVKFSKNNEALIGRSDSCEITIKDSSINEIHAKLQLIDNEIYVADCLSKFGTLVELKEP
jgi:pSer/pThr/pTyr-binding forkhead associated (FHA) protein